MEPSTDAVPTCDEAIGNAVRLRRQGEMTTDRELMSRLDDFAATWVRIAELQHERA